MIAAVLTLLLASFSFYSDLGVPFAIAVGVTLLAALTLLPALLSIRLSLLGVKRTLFQRMFGRPKLLPWNIQGSGQAGHLGPGRRPDRPAPDADPARRPGVLRRAGDRGHRLQGRRASAAAPAPPAGSDSAAGQALLTKYFPQSSANPTSLIFRFGTPVWHNPAPLATATGPAPGQRPVHPGHRAAEPGRARR